MLGRAAPLVIAFSLIAPAVQASPECMTKQEARAKWPMKPIYWHGSSRCWNDQPLSSRRSTTPPANTSDSATKALAFVSTPLPKATKTEVLFPSIIVNNSVNTDLFNRAPMTGWPVLIDIDGQAPDPYNGVDRCCWPSLDALKALIGAVK
jgi:hypothetical protein